MVRSVIAGAAFACAFAAPLAGLGSAPRQVATPQQAPKATGLIVGQVVDADSGRPVPGAILSLTPSLPATETRRVIANGEGRFMFHGVPPGRVNLSASASSYIPAFPGQRRPQGPSQQLVLGDDERLASVVIRMWKYAAIEGRVVDEHNEPAVATQVRIWRRDWGGGRRRLTPGVSVMTDDRGAFRVAQLVPGDYYVSVPFTQQTMPVSVAQQYQALQEGGRGTGASELLRRQLSGSRAPVPLSSGQRMGDYFLQLDPGLVGLPGQAGAKDRMLVYPMTFEPGLDQEPIRLDSGEQRQGVLLALRSVRGVQVSGVLTGPDGPVAHMGVQLIQSSVYGTTSLVGVETAKTATDANGAFTFLGVPADKYTLTALYAPRPVPTGTTAVTTEPTLFAGMDVAVGEEDLVGLNVPLRHGARLTGTVVFDGVSTPPSPEQIALIQVSARPATGGFMLNLVPGRVDSDLKVQTPGYPAGRYYVTASAPSPAWTLASAMVGARDVSRSAIEIGDADVSNLVLTFSDKRTEVSGAVRSSAAGGDPEAIVLVLPSDIRGWMAEGMNPRLTTTVRTTPAGTYTIGGLLPGDYRVIALSEDFAFEARDPIFLERLGQLGTTIALREGEKRTLDLRTESPPRFPPDPIDSSSTGGPFVEDSPQAMPQAPARDVTSVVQRGTAVISGRVVTNDPNQKPLRKVHVTLIGAAVPFRPAVLTDDDGRFLFRDLPAGRFMVMATRPPYVETYYGSSRPGRAGTTLALSEGQQVMDLTIPMTRGAVIEGTILNEFGLPEERASVTLFQQRAGGAGLQMVATANTFNIVTDDRGRYRVYGLTAGEYLVASRPGYSTTSDVTRITDADMKWAATALSPAGTVSPAPSSPPIAAVPVFHPGVTDAANAQVVKLGTAEERTGVDINLVTVPAARVNGRVVTADGQGPAQLQVAMVVDGPRVPLGNPTTVVRPTADGSFQALGVAPGRYMITARAASGTAGVAASASPSSRGGGPVLDLWALQTVEVNGQDITGISMTLAPGLTVRGRVVFEATTAAPPEKFAGVSVRLSPPSTSGGSLGAAPVAVTEDGRFALPGLTPNAYRLTATVPGRTGPRQTWALKSIVVGGRDMSDAPLVVTPESDVADVVVTMTDRITEITGLLLDPEGKPVPELTIVVFPQDKAQWGRDSRRRLPPTRPASDGRYRVVGLPPGEYFIVAVSEFNFDEMFDEGLLESLIPSAMKVSLAPGETKTQDFKLAGR